jgi:hypothetical protein
VSHSRRLLGQALSHTAVDEALLNRPFASWFSSKSVFARTVPSSFQIDRVGLAFAAPIMGSVLVDFGGGVGVDGYLFFMRAPSSYLC